MGKTKEPVTSEQRQPALFAPEQLPEMPSLLAAAKSFCHTGRITCRDEEHAQSILSHYLMGGSLRQTSKRFQVSPNTIKGVLTIFEGSGKLDALKQRLSHKLGVVIELATDLLTERLQDGSVQSNVLPIVIGVGVEKKALIDGEATSRTESKPAEPARLGDLAAYLREHGVETLAIDVQSTVSN